MSRDRRGEPQQATPGSSPRTASGSVGKTTLTQLLVLAVPPPRGEAAPAGAGPATVQRKADAAAPLMSATNQHTACDVTAVFGRPMPAGDGPVQRSANSSSPDADAPAAPEIAARGVAGAGAPLPHLQQIQASFGHHDVSGVRTHQGPPVAAAAHELGADAYAIGNAVAFSRSPDLHTAAHEAAHVVQQRRGVQLNGGIDQPGDAYEQHADAVADAVVAGQSAAPLLDQVAGHRGSQDVSVQRTPASSGPAPTAAGADPKITPPNAGINKPGFIDNSDGANIRTGPRETGGQTLRGEPLPPATRVFVSGTHPSAPDWWYVTATLHDKAMVRGYVQGGRVNVDLPEPLAELRQLVGGETAEGLAKEKFGHAVTDGHDLRYYENVLLHVNQGRAGIRGTYQDPGILGGGSNNIQLAAGHRIWLVSAEYAKALQSVVPSGSLTGGAVAKAKRFARHLEDILQSVTESRHHFEEVAGQFAQAIRDHLEPIIGFTAAFLIAEAGSMFLAAVPTGVSQAAAVVIQLALSAFGISGMVQAGIEALKHASAWLTMSWTANSKPDLIAEASKEFLRMLVAIAVAALSYVGAKGNYGNALKIANQMPAGGLPALATVGVRTGGGAGTAAGVSIGPSAGSFGTAGAQMVKHEGADGGARSETSPTGEKHGESPKSGGEEGSSASGDSGAWKTKQAGEHGEGAATAQPRGGLRAEQQARLAQYLEHFLSDAGERQNVLAVVSEVQRHPQIEGLGDWIDFSLAARPEAEPATVRSNLLDDVNELRVALDIVRRDPTAHVRIGNDARTALRPGTPDEKLSSFDLSVTRGGEHSNVEVRTVDGDGLSAEDLGRAINHARDKIVEGPNLPQAGRTPGRVEGALVATWPQPRQMLSAGRSIDINVNGDVVMMMPNGRQVPQGNLFSDYLNILNGNGRGSAPAGASEVDALTIYDRSGKVVQRFCKDKNGVWTRDSGTDQVNNSTVTTTR